LHPDHKIPSSRDGLGVGFYSAVIHSLCLLDVSCVVIEILVSSH
jgi:hypothetical protein